jgi:hypothetical protein
MTYQAAQPAGLISVLLDPSAPFGDRHDAAMDLGCVVAAEAEAALLQVALNLTEDPDIADAAGESLRSIWSRTGKWDAKLTQLFHPEARKFFTNTRA